MIGDAPFDHHTASPKVGPSSKNILRTNTAGFGCCEPWLGVIKASVAAARHCLATIMPHWCSHCNAGGVTNHCSRCKGVWYCNRQCQQRHWRTHKIFCSAVRTPAITTAGRRPDPTTRHEVGDRSAREPTARESIGRTSVERGVVSEVGDGGTSAAREKASSQPVWTGQFGLEGFVCTELLSCACCVAS